MNTSKLLNILLATALLVVVIVTTMREPKNSATESQGDRTVSAGDTLAIIHQRKSVRKYTDQLVMTEQLETLAKAGMAAPTAMNRQPWTMVAITDRNVLDKLAGDPVDIYVNGRLIARGEVLVLNDNFSANNTPIRASFAYVFFHRRRDYWAVAHIGF